MPSWYVAGRNDFSCPGSTEGRGPETQIVRQLLWAGTVLYAILYYCVTR